jgi:hypothetical protein
MIRQRLALCVTALVFGASVSGCGTGKDPGSANPGSDDAVAQKVAAALAERGDGKVQGAAYVAGLYTQMAAADAWMSSVASGPSDKLIIVKLFGAFHPQHSVLRGQVPAPATTLITVFDITTGRTLANEFVDAPAPDVMNAGKSGASVVPDGKTYRDLRSFGSPRPLSVGG